VLDLIAAVKVDGNNRPLQDVPMKMAVTKMKKKKITKAYGFSFDD
jgi:hypothetical protein